MSQAMKSLQPGRQVNRVTECSVNGCGEEHLALGFCRRHYGRYKRGKSLDSGNRRKSQSVSCHMDGCDRTSRARGLCARHYQRFRKTGVVQRAENAEEHFWSKVDKSNDCWIWRGYLNDKGYGVAHYAEGRIYAHRLSYQLCVGDIPPEQVLRHRCDNPCCVNPDHLTPGTQAQNVGDAIERGRWMQSTRIGRQAKLTEEDVSLIIRRLSSGETSRSVAADFGVHETTISRIRRGESWAHLSRVSHDSRGKSDE